jgi:hypothetical protein
MAWVAFALAGWGAVSAQGSASVTAGGAVSAVGARAAEQSVSVSRVGVVAVAVHKTAMSIRPE